MLNKINNYFCNLKNTIDNLDKNKLEDFIKLLIEAKNNNKTIFLMGNGGSACTCSHWACDFNKGISYNQDKKFKLFCLNDNIATMLAYANDISYEDIFVEQLKNFLQEGDIVIGFSGSGNSKNILKAIEYANSKNAKTIGLTGYNGGKLKEIVSFSLDANFDNMQISEDIHMIIGHLIYNLLADCNIEDEI